MKISSDDVELLAASFESASKTGDLYLCYWEQADYFKNDDLHLFKNKYEASEFCFEQSTDRDTYGVTLIALILAVVKNFKEQLSVLGENAAGISFPFSIAEIEQQTRITHEFNSKMMENENATAQQSEALNTNGENKPTEGVINEKNLAYLEDQLVKTGFGDIQREELIRNVIEGKDSFQLNLQKKYGEEQATATLNFNKSDKGNYFFGNYELVVKNEAATDDFKQRFKVNYGNTFSLKEAFNLMQGRSVFKKFINVDIKDKANNKPYEAWATMDFKDADKDGNFKIQKTYNFNLEQELGQYPFKELGNTTYRKELIDSIQRGNRQSVTYVKGDKEEKMYVEANPGHKSLKLHDAQMNPLKLSMKAKTESQAAENKQGQSQDAQRRQGQRAGKAA